MAPIGSKSSIGVIFADIYQLGLPHDKYGHAPIDNVLREVGHVVRSLANEGDMACRYGGDEFLLIIMDVTERETRQRAEELRQAAAKVQIIYEGESREHITLSIGVAHYDSRDRQRSNSRLHRADLLLQVADADLQNDRARNALTDNP